jgi:RNA polymerase sigma-70 factor (ECF subfamily)
MLQVAFAPDDDALPQVFIDLLDRLAAAAESRTPAPGTLSDAEFKAALLEIMPRLRAFARSLSGDASQADDLVQDTLIRAWNARDRFQKGTSFKAWSFTILRNLFLSGMRRTRYTAEWNDNVAERVLVASADQDRHLHVADVEAALQKLPEAQRQVLMLVGAEQLTYEQAAEICGVPLGTIKSRVARGREALLRLIDGEPDEDAA